MLKQPSPEYRGFRAPGIRLREEMLPQLARLTAGRSRLMLHALHAFDKAQAVMLVEEGLLAREHGQAILKALRQMERDGVEEVRTRTGGGLHSGEQYLIRALGEEIGGRLHLGRSSGDLSAVGINTLQRERVLRILEGVNRLRRVLIGLSRQHTDTILPGYSFGQHAQPMTLAHLLLSWAANLARDSDRLHGVYRRVNTSPAGAAIMVGSDFPLNRTRTAELLGFDAIHENMADAILELNADDSLDVPMAVAILYHTMAKWADDLILWSTSEFAFVDIPDRFCNTSSIMMQKKNVIGPAEVKGASAEALGCVVTSYHALKGPTGLPITERHYALEMLWRVCDDCARDLDWFCELLPALGIRRDHMREQAWRHWATATDLAGARVHTGQTPVRAVGPTDQHSQLQLYVDGPPDKVVVFLRVEEHANDLVVPKSYEDIEAVAYLGGHGLGALVNMEQQGTELALAKAGRPTSMIVCPRVNAFLVGQLFYLLEMEVAIVGALLGINTFDQPGVEEGKQLTYGLAGRPGYEGKRADVQRWVAQKDPQYLV